MSDKDINKTEELNGKNKHNPENYRKHQRAIYKYGNRCKSKRIGL